MKAKLLLAFFVLGGLSSCQQSEQEFINDQSFGFISITDGLTTRAINQIDVVSLCADTETNFSIFDLTKDRKSWSDYQSDVKFYAHYPKLNENESKAAERIVQGGAQYLFAVSTARLNSSTIALKFGDMATKFNVKVKNSDGTISTPKSLKLKLKNRGKQNLKNGSIILLDSSSEAISFATTDNEELSGYILPQTIPAGTMMTAVMGDGVTITARVKENVTLKPGDIYDFVFDKNQADIIIDPAIPL